MKKQEIKKMTKDQIIKNIDKTFLQLVIVLVDTLFS